jgi:PAS domain S-box-containing protein
MAADTAGLINLCTGFRLQICNQALDKVVLRKPLVYNNLSEAGDLPVAKKIFIALAIIFTGASVFLFNSFYKEAKKIAITKLNEEQMIHAKQAAQGIEDFFATWTRNLSSLSKMDEIIDNDAAGKRYMKLFYEANQEQIKSITRLDERGVIVHNFPISNSVGTDISDQNHIREMLRNHKPVISDVFRAVEGFDAVALHVPVFKGSEFKGAIGILINFESLAKRYLDVIKIGETGYAWVVSRDGTLLYSPIPGFTGKSVFETTKDFPSAIAMANDMLKGHEGAAIYSFDRIGDRNVGRTRKYAVYMPVRIGDTFWSIAVVSAEQDVLSGLISFRNKLALVIGAIFICGMAFSTLGAKAWFIVKEEEKRSHIEKQLRESEERLKDIMFSMADWVWEVDENGVYTYSSSKGLELFGNIIGKTPFDFMPPDEANRVAAIFSEIAANKAPIKDLENWNIRKNGERICLLTNGVPILDEEGNLKGYRGVDKDITERKRNEEKLIDSQKTLRAFTSRLLTIQEEERRRLARELHDDFTQRLAVLAMDMSMLEVSAKAANPKFELKLKSVREQIIKLSTDIHDISRQLHPSIIDDLGLGRAIQSECINFTKRAGIEINYKPISIPLTIPRDISIGLFRITQEALRNIQKHAQVKQAEVCLAGGEGCITLTIKDSGAGFDPAYARQIHGLGLFSMEERAQLIQGVFSMDSTPGRGTQIKVIVPLKGMENG